MDLFNIALILFIFYAISNAIYHLYATYNLHQMNADPFEPLSFDKEYRHISTTIEYLDELEKRIKEFHDAPSKICNARCTKRQEFLKQIYGQAARLFSSIQAVHLVQLKKNLDKLEQRYKKKFKKMNIEIQLRKWEEQHPAYT